jgi:hypothetical protein
MSDIGASRVRAVTLHKLRCAGVGATIAYAIIHGRPEALGVAVLAVAAMAASASRPTWPVTPSRCRRRRVPGFHAYVTERAGSPLRPLAFLHRLLLGPLAAPSPSVFWRQWNPPLGYLLLFYVYFPLRRVLPRPAAVLGTFVTSGFLLHDLPANGAGVLGGWSNLSGTLLLTVLGLLTVLAELCHLDLSGRPTWVRVLANLSLLSLGFAMRGVILSVVR